MTPTKHIAIGTETGRADRHAEGRPTVDLVFRVVGWLLVAVSSAGLVVAMRVLRREAPVRVRHDVLRVAITLGSAAVITAVLGRGRLPG